METSETTRELERGEGRAMMSEMESKVRGRCVGGRTVKILEVEGRGRARGGADRLPRKRKVSSRVVKGMMMRRGVRKAGAEGLDGVGDIMEDIRVVITRRGVYRGSSRQS